MEACAVEQTTGRQENRMLASALARTSLVVGSDPKLGPTVSVCTMWYGAGFLTGGSVFMISAFTPKRMKISDALQNCHHPTIH
jgi:hypothetical protein